MGYIVTAYSKRAYKNFLLPAVINENYSIILHKNLFQISDDLELKLENIGGFWHVIESTAFDLFYTDSKESCFGQNVKDRDVCSLKLKNGELITLVVRVTDKALHVFEKFDLSGLGHVRIGAGTDNEISYDFMHIVSKAHAVIHQRGQGHSIEDKSRNGVFVNAKRIASEQSLKYGDLINIFGLAIVYLGNCIAVDTLAENVTVCREQLRQAPNVAENHAEPDNNGEIHIFHRSPRYFPKLATEKIKIEAPPTPKEANQQSLLLTIGPSMTMALPMMLGCGLAIYSTRLSGGSSSAFMYTGIVTAVSSAVLGTIWALVNIHQTKKKLREEELKRFEMYGEYLIACADQVKEDYNRNTQIMRQLYVEPSVCCRYDHTSAQLWNRNRNHPDFLHQRLGTGEIPFQVSIEIPQERFSMVNDSLASKAKMIQENYAMLQDVPMCADLGIKLIGLVGGRNRAGCYPIVYNLTAQIAANNCYTDVKMGFIFDSSTDEISGSWDFAKWLPHVWSEDKKVRYVADNPSDASDVFYELSKILRMRAEGSSGRQAVQYKPHYVLFIEDTTVLEGELISTFLLDKRDLGVTVILLAERDEDLPNACEYIIENTAEFQGMYFVTDPIEDRPKIRFDSISADEITRFARTLSGIQVNEIETGGELPSTLTFLDMYGVQRLQELHVAERWRKNRTYENIRGLLGQKSGGAPCYLDVHEKYHGPHGLIAGTTGSGKSETLQTYMLSLAINYSPDDIGFFIIDYKGGGMANLFANLPHMIGQISNLSGNQVHRAMVSIKSENVRRQRVFNEHGVNNINHYTQLYKNGEATLPVPHMFIIIDEFAELKREEPDFMKELISVAQVGRSLGVHLILATQKPSGTVDDNIWSNAKFRLCLRVQDTQDSKDMLHRPDAAYITQAGRCYLQVGNDELFELFQSGWSGATYDESADSSQSDLAQMLSVTGKAALVGSHMKIKERELESLRWIESLIEILRECYADPTEVAECLTDAIKLESIAEQVFLGIEARQIDYPRTDYNLQRVKDFIVACGEAVHQWTTSDADAGLVLQYAAQHGRKLPEVKKKTQLEAIVEYLGDVAAANGYVHNLKLWLPVLPERIFLAQLPGYLQNSFDGENWPVPTKEWSLEAFVGLCDDPVNQAQMPLQVSFSANGHHAICGTVVSGKSTFLVTLLYSLIMRYTPEMLNIYALDYSSKMLSAFEDAAHVGGVMYENDDERIGKFFTMMSSILEERKVLFRGGNYKQYMQSGQGTLPAIVVAIDNYSAFRTKTNNIYDDFVLKLSKEGVSCGIFLVITAMGFSAGEIPSRLGENLRTVICLEMNDKFAYSDALRTLHLDVVPEANVRGRGLAKVGDSYLEFQTALSLEAEDDFMRSSQIREACQNLNANWTGRRARKIPEIPEKPVWSEFCQLDEMISMQRNAQMLPIGYDQKNASVYGIALQNTYCYLISGRARTGKTNLMKIMIAAAFGMDVDVVVIDYAKEFAAVVEGQRAKLITSDQELYEYFLELQPRFIERNQFKKKCLDAGDTDEELYEHMQGYRKIMLFIGSLAEFVQHTAKPEGDVASMAGFISNLLDKGANHNVYWFACADQDTSSKVAGQQVYELFIRYKDGIHFGGNVAGQRILDFEYLKYSERTKTCKPGIGMIPQKEGVSTTHVVVPLYRK